MPPVEKKRMTAADKKAVCSMLETLSINQQSPGAAFSAFTAHFDVCRTTTACLWKQIQSKIPNLPTNEDDDDGSDSGRATTSSLMSTSLPLHSTPTCPLEERESSSMTGMMSRPRWLLFHFRKEGEQECSPLNWRCHNQVSCTH